MINLGSEIIANISCEDELLLCFARTSIDDAARSKILSLLKKKNFDWSYLLKRLLHHGLRQLFFSNLSDLYREFVPQEVFSRLKKDFIAIAFNNFRLTGELCRLLDQFKNAGITAIPYKGPALACLAYNDIALREFCDLDIWINSKDAQSVKKILTENGYESSIKDLNCDADYITKFYAGFPAFLNNKTRINVDIQWRPEGHSLVLPKYAAKLYDEFCTVKINDSEVASFKLENLLLILAMHASMHCWEKLIWLCDIAELVKRYEINWHYAINLASRLKIKKIFAANLSLAQILFDVNFPEEIAEFIAVRRSVAFLVDRALTVIFSQKYPCLSKTSKAIIFIVKKDDVFDVLKDCWHWLVTPKPEDLDIIKLPGSLYLLYCVIRPLHLLMSSISTIVSRLFRLFIKKKKSLI